MSAPPDILLEIVERRREGFESGDLPVPARERCAALAAAHPFLRALSREGPAVIAEIKMGSPRIGSLTGRLDPEAQARLYRDGGAAALSVVVEPNFFGGSYELLARCKEVSGLPTIAKDFVVSTKQIDDALAAGADAVLVIASLYSAEDLHAWACYARSQGIVPLIETHGSEDRAKLEGHEWELVGVNNRDLRTFEVDLGRSIAALPDLPASALKVAESGIGSSADVARLAEAGFDAFLVGESLLLADDPAAKLTELLSRVAHQKHRMR
jgi:indole-3-glycerol phosphate synthase